MTVGSASLRTPARTSTVMIPATARAVSMVSTKNWPCTDIDHRCCKGLFAELAAV